MENVIYVIVYLTGVIFDLAVITYLNERKGEMYFSGFALASWAGLLVFLLIGIDAVLNGVCDFFRFLFRERHGEYKAKR